MTNPDTVNGPRLRHSVRMMIQITVTGIGGFIFAVSGAASLWEPLMSCSCCDLKGISAGLVICAFGTCAFFCALERDKEASK